MYRYCNPESSENCIYKDGEFSYYNRETIKHKRTYINYYPWDGRRLSEY